MLKYRLLSLDELKELEKEFIDYLILNGITAEDWEKLKYEEIESAERIIELFSDVVFESIMRKVEFIEKRNSHEVQSIQCLKDKMVLVGMKTENHEADFTDSEYVKKALDNPPSSLKIFTISKNYIQQREKEIFDMIQSGAFISDVKLFKTMCLALT